MRLSALTGASLAAPDGVSPAGMVPPVEEAPSAAAAMTGGKEGKYYAEERHVTVRHTCETDLGSSERRFEPCLPR